MTNLQNILKQAQKIQSQVSKMQAELGERRIEASAGGGMVTVKMNGQKQVLEVRIEPEVLADRDMLQDMVAAAVNEAGRKVDAEMQSELANMAGGLAWTKLPGLF